MARNFVFTPPSRLCKKFESIYFSFDWLRLINSCCIVAFHPPSYIFCAKILHNFSICIACVTYWGLVASSPNGKFPYIYVIFALEWSAPPKSCTNWKLKSLWCPWFFDSCKIFNVTCVGSLLFGGYPVSSILPSFKLPRIKKDRGVCHIILIDHFYVYLKHYKPFVKRFY